jgi:hypothetical protein
LAWLKRNKESTMYVLSLKSVMVIFPFCSL